MDKRVVSADPLQGMQMVRIASGFVERFPLEVVVVIVDRFNKSEQSWDPGFSAFPGLIPP